LRISIFAIKPSLVPALGMTRRLGCRKGAVLSSLNRNSTKLYTRTIGELGLMVDVEEFPEERDSWLCLEVYLAENLKLAEICD
jgi:hypothetical protein